MARHNAERTIYKPIIGNFPAHRKLPCTSQRKLVDVDSEETSAFVPVGVPQGPTCWWHPVWLSLTMLRFQWDDYTERVRSDFRNRSLRIMDHPVSA